MKQPQVWRSQPASSWRFWYVLLQYLAFLPVKLVFRLAIKRDPEIKGLYRQGPLVVIAPHQSFLDPVFVAYGVGMRLPLRFVATDLLLRNKLGRWFISHTGCIPIAQFSSDTGAIRTLLQTLKQGQSIAIFPEGERTLDGSHELPRNALLRIFKRAEATIIGVEIDGAYLTWPRWSQKGFGRGKVAISSKVLVHSAEIRELSDEDLASRLEPLFNQTDYDWQRRRIASGKRAYHYPQRTKTCGLEILLHSCPVCHSLQTMYAEGNKLECSACHNQISLSGSGLLEVGEELVSPVEWHFEQQVLTRQNYPEGLERLCRGYTYHPTANNQNGVVNSLPGTLKLTPDGKLSFISEDVEWLLETSSLDYPLSNNAYIQFFCKQTKERHRFVFEKNSDITLFIDYLQTIKEDLCKDAVK